jgi:hypothetical protein
MICEQDGVFGTFSRYPIIQLISFNRKTEALPYQKNDCSAMGHARCDMRI